MKGRVEKRNTRQSRLGVLQINIRFISDISGWQSVKISLFNTKISKYIKWTYKIWLQNIYQILYRQYN